MIDLIKKLIGADDGAADGGRADKRTLHEVHLATCAVFLEVAQIDNEFDEKEREHILSVFQREYGLSRDEVLEIKSASKEQLDKSVDLWKFTNVVNQHYSSEEKYHIVTLLWELVYADGKLDEHENYFMHKLRRMLKLTHSDLIDAKLEVLQKHRNSEGD